MSRRKQVTKKGKFHDWITEEGLEQIEEWARNGLINRDIAYNIGIAQGTFYEWIKRFPEIDEALKRGKKVVDEKVESALLRKALGYEYEEVTVEDSETRGRTVKTTKKHVQPDTTAQIFWLKNRKPFEWRDRRNIELEGAIETNPFKDLTTEELRKLAEDK